MEKQSVKKVYLSLPISGYDIDERVKTAKTMEYTIKEKGKEVCNPLGEGWEFGHTTYEYMEKDIRMLLDCDTVMFMNGWNKSAGCHTEMCVAVACGKNIVFENTVQINI